MSVTGERLKALREARGWTQEEVARRLNVSRAAVGHWERGKNEPSYDTLIRLARLYNTSTAYLIGETDDPSPLTAAQGRKRPRSVPPAGWGRLTDRQKEYVRRVTDEMREIMVKELLDGEQ